MFYIKYSCILLFKILVLTLLLFCLDMHLHPESRGVSVDRLIYTADELISLSLEYYDK